MQKMKQKGASCGWLKNTATRELINYFCIINMVIKNGIYDYKRSGRKMEY